MKDNIFNILYRKISFQRDKIIVGIARYLFNHSNAFSLLMRKFGTAFVTIRKPTKIPCLYSLKKGGIYDSYFPLTSINTSVYEQVYFSSNDKFPIPPRDFEVFVAVSNIDALNILSHTEPHTILFYDYNVDQLVYLKKVVELILASNSRVDFISTFFGVKQKVVRDWLINQEDDAILACTSTRSLLSGFKHVNINGKVVGIAFPDLNLVGKIKFLLTLSSESKVKGYTVFPIIRENGFLSSDERFNTLKQLLSHCAVYFTATPMSVDFINNLGSIFRYEKIGLWTSNIFSPYFYHRPIRKSAHRLLAQQVLEQSPCLHVLNDKRWELFKSSFLYRLTPHKKTFGKIIHLINGKSAEVVATAERSFSTLPNTTLFIWKSFIDSQDNFDTLFFHLLLYNGVPLKDIKKAFNMKITKRILVLEHSSETFSKGVTRLELENVFGKASAYHPINFGGKVRNHLLVYNLS